MTDSAREQRSQRLRAGAEALSVQLDADAVERLLDLLDLLQRWNRAYNLTAVDAPDEALVKHVLDSLAALAQVHGPRVLDVGTGAGFPGLPFAIARPDLELTLLDSHRKKLRFVEQAAATLGLPNVSTVQERIEQYAPAQPYDTVTCRALTELARFVDWAGHLVAPDGRLLALKARVEAAEIDAIGPGWQAQVVPVVVPFLDGRRSLVVVTRRPASPNPGVRT